MNTVLRWLKSNVYTVIAVAIMIAAPIGMWILSGNMNKAVQEEVDSRAKKMSELDRFEKTSVSFHYPVPGNEPVSANIAVNRQFLDRYEEVVAVIRKDMERVREEVFRINHKDRQVLVPELFPEPPVRRVETLPQNMYRALQGAYEQLIVDSGAGDPPSTEEMVENLIAAQDRYLATALKRTTSELTEEEQAGLAEQLTKTRMSYYADAAKGLNMYAALDDLNVPSAEEYPDRAEGDGMSRMFDWQWRFWIKQDILSALAMANEPYNSIVDAPVKRVVSLFITDDPGSASSASSAPAAGGGSGFGTAGSAKSGRRRGGSKSKSSGSTAKRGSADPGREVPLDYSYSFTGRKTNPLFDVRRVEVELIVDSERMPEVFDALARYNFMTIVKANVETVSLFDAIKSGYFYGSRPVSLIRLDLETVWFREWTTEFMPPELKAALGVPETPKSKG
jgi:hypothetical protein